MRAIPLFMVSLVAVAVGLVVAERPASAQLIIKNPNDHPDYRVELEPHGTIGLFHRNFYGGRGGPGGLGGGGFVTPDVGAGFRASIEIVDPVIPKLNNTIAISFGLDLTNCSNGDYCNRRGAQFYAPEGGVQWNFFLTPKFSAFADIGLMLHSFGFYKDNYFDFYGMLGGRYHISRSVALTFRIGYPFVTFGPSFFL